MPAALRRPRARPSAPPTSFFEALAVVAANALLAGFAALALIAALVACGPGPARAAGAPSRVLVETLFLDLPAERRVHPAEGFNELAAGGGGAVLSSPNLLVDDGDLGELALPPSPGAPGGADGGVRSALEEMHLRVRPSLVGEGGVRLELDVDLHPGERALPLRANFEGRLGQAFVLDAGVESGGRRLAIAVKAEAVRDPDALRRLRERDVRTRDGFRDPAPRGPGSADRR